MSASKRDALALEIIETVPGPRLMAVACGIERECRKRRGEVATFEMTGEDALLLLTDIMQTFSIRKLKQLREMALGLEEQIERFN
jgi:hypothetical protein